MATSGAAAPNIAENPTTDMRERALASAYKGTFMNELGPRGRDWQKFTKGNARCSNGCSRSATSR
jgi:hypothetical protein